MAAPSASSRRRLRRPLLVTVLVLVGTWFMFFDSHSLIKRIRWHHEYAQFTRENNALRQEIDELEEVVGQPLPDDVVEQIAREQYGMRRPGETVYPVEKP